jgi:hypothetical protein
MKKKRMNGITDERIDGRGCFQQKSNDPLIHLSRKTL